MGFSEIDDCDADSVVGGYIVDDDVDVYYIELESDFDRDVYETFAKTNPRRRNQGKHGRTI